MDAEPARLLLVNGLIVLCSGVLSGVPFWLAIIRRRDAATVRAWGVAHSTLIADGLLLLVVSLISPQLALGGYLLSFLAWTLIVSGYSFVFALVVGAWWGYRGLTLRPVGINTVFFVGHVIGAVGSLLGICMVLYGVLRQ
jgi:hypothetical protein